MGECLFCNKSFDQVLKHTNSEEHKVNALKSNVNIKLTADDFIRHYEKVLIKTKDQVDNDREHPFWVTAKEELDDKNFKKVREYIYGGTTRKRSTRRWNTKYRRPGRLVRRIKTNRKKIHKRGQNSRL